MTKLNLSIYISREAGSYGLQAQGGQAVAGLTLTASAEDEGSGVRYELICMQKWIAFHRPSNDDTHISEPEHGVQV